MFLEQEGRQGGHVGGQVCSDGSDLGHEKWHGKEQQLGLLCMFAQRHRKPATLCRCVCGCSDVDNKYNRHSPNVLEHSLFRFSSIIYGPILRVQLLLR